MLTEARCTFDAFITSHCRLLIHTHLFDVYLLSFVHPFIHYPSYSLAHVRIYSCWRFFLICMLSASSVVDFNQTYINIYTLIEYVWSVVKWIHLFVGCLRALPVNALLNFLQPWSCAGVCRDCHAHLKENNSELHQAPLWSQLYRTSR